ncbi:MAG TPA: helix-turn-helix transcriptional regulator [Pyrinomonadaceae bacterium]|nr:helix-turn-helix transcriptional regulator [Pyrinomonadaceae bacterium]
MQHDFGLWLLEKRRAAGLTQRELARRVSISKSYVSALERNERQPLTGQTVRPKLEKVDALAEALGVPVGEARLAAGYAPPELNTNQIDQRLLNHFRELPENAKHDVAVMIEGLYRKYKRKTKEAVSDK